MAANEEILRRLGELDGLYAKDPERFEVLARELIESVIADFPPEDQPRARGLQFVVDSRLALHSNPLGRMVEMMDMLWESVDRLVAALNDPWSVCEERQQCRSQSRIIPFPVSRQKH
ncbi:hypothetical protein DSOUD_2587 [Desulfuromonas soudanensis]|uniref:Uncharacterized protein n=1 Tax=Desulfuromonas soudanensis TaxID=1603606 RepID=A0A0M4D286_9BACT|nr:DUF3135 domain-containing protein [Desulfuromonas soudanensis]ALC17340.1 hypothetical protein DSOUD_2587 [Desulfuromonas soudanensis]